MHINVITQHCSVCESFAASSAQEFWNAFTRMSMGIQVALQYILCLELLAADLAFVATIIPVYKINVILEILLQKFLPTMRTFFLPLWSD